MPPTSFHQDKRLSMSVVRMLLFCKLSAIHHTLPFCMKLCNELMKKINNFHHRSCQLRHKSLYFGCYHFIKIFITTTALISFVTKWCWFFSWLFVHCKISCKKGNWCNRPISTCTYFHFGFVVFHELPSSVKRGGKACTTLRTVRLCWLDI